MTPDERLHTFLTFITAVEDGQSIREACKTADIAWGSLARWLADTANTVTDGSGRPETFAARYARARITSATGFAERALDTALNATDAQLARLQVDTLKWRAAMADPKNYGERRQVEVSGGIEHLHLDALRSTITAKASIDNSLPHATLPHAQPIDTEGGP